MSEIIASTEQTVKSSKTSKIGIAFSVLSLLTVSIIGIYGLGKVSDLQSQLEQLKSEKAAMQAKVDDSYKWLGFQAFNHNFEGAATDNFAVDKVVLQYSTGTLKGYLDLSPQPDLFTKYKGDGKFDVPDRELKSMLLANVEQLRDAYNNNFANETVPPWDKGEIFITVKNYDVGTFSNGKITLKGE